ncbi:MAG: hypothetical protein K6C96_07855 [Butyrivibrio sp.]|nr:hypothetical protein [Butyrivibrio sp.]
MVKTREIYYEDAYISEFDATVLECSKRDKGGFSVVLDATAFFPEQGGQSSDIGVLRTEDGAEVYVSHTAIGGGIISHFTDTAIEPGSKVHGDIDWQHRFSNMQQHTGEHIFSGIVNSRFGYDNVGFHLSDSEVTMDYSGPISDEDIRKIELAVNEAIWQNVAVRCEFPSDEELASIDYRSKKELSGQIRIVTVEGYDVCACCAPHVLRTGEIGLLKVVGCQNYKGGVRVSILCGKRALDYLTDCQKLVSDLTGFFTTESGKVMDAVTRQKDEIFELKGRLGAVSEKLLKYEIDELAASGHKDGVFIVRDHALDGNEMRKTANALTERFSGISGVFAPSGDGYRYIIASGSDGINSRDIQQKLFEAFGAKGGGSPQMVQGSISCDNIAEVIKLLEETKV